MMSPENGTGPETVTIILGGKKHTLDYHDGETILETARRGGLKPPSSCEQGNCGTCLAEIRAGAARMMANNVLEPDEVAEGLVLTCQGIPTTQTITVEYED